MANSYSFLIIDTYYPQFLSSLYYQFPELANKRYKEQVNLITEQCFGTADYYSKNLKKLGCEAEEIIPNNEILQKQWALENGFRIEESFLTKVLKRIPGTRRMVIVRDCLLRILEKQIKRARPDVLYMQNLSFCPPDLLSEMKRYARLVVGQIACPLPPLDYLKPYDLILTSFPHYAGRFREMGIRSEYFRIAFDPSVLEKAGSVERKYNCTFVGGISPAHKKGTMLLEELARKVDINFFGYGADTLDKDSPIISRHHGEVWGLDMYRTLLSSRITVNRHIDVAENYANNMRLYEATGCSVLLITDYKDNLNDLFEIGKEVVTYQSADELVDLIKYYEKNIEERERIAKAGQQRTLSEHSYFNRMEELLGIVSRYF